MLSLLELQALSKLGPTDRLKAVANKFGYGDVTNQALREIDDFIPKAPRNPVHDQTPVEEPKPEEVKPVNITNKKMMPAPKPKEMITTAAPKKAATVLKKKAPPKKAATKSTPKAPSKPTPKKGE